MTKLTFRLQLLASKLGSELIQLLGMPVFVEGNVIQLEYTKLQVVEACSGLNSLISLFVLTLLLTYFFRDHIWKRAVLLLSAVPLAISLNGMRIAMTAVLYKYWGPAVADGFFHSFSGMVMFLASLPLLLAEMWILQQLPPRRRKGGQQPEGKEQEGVKSAGPDFRQWVPQFLTAGILLGLTLGLSTGIEFRENTPILRTFDTFPLQVETWESRGLQSMEERFINALDLTDYVIADYVNTQGRSVNLYVAYYASQSKGKSIHSPATCLPGSGWDFRQSGIARINLSPNPGHSFAVNRAVMQKGSTRQVVYYWMPQRGRILTNAYQLKLYAFWDALTRQRTDGALVRAITKVREQEDIEQAEARLKDFVRDIVPVLEKFIPGNDPVSNQLG